MAAVTNFASGLRYRPANRGVRVITILPGFVDLPMKALFHNGILKARVEAVAKYIEQTLQSRSGVQYTPRF